MRRPSARAARRVGGALAVVTTLAIVLTIGTRPTLAAWVTRADLSEPMGVASSSCTTPGVYRTTAASRWLAGSVGGTALTSVPALAATTADNPASTAVFPAGATPRGADAASGTVTSSAVSAAVAGLTAPSGSQTQYAGATSTGRSTAATGAVTNGGAIDTAGIAAGTRAAVGSIDVSAALAAVSGGTTAAGPLSQLGLSVGSAASAASLDECARRWGASLTSALSRSTTVSGLTLTTRDAAVTALLADVTTQRGHVSDAFAALTDAGTANALATTAKTGLVGGLGAALSTIGLSTVLGAPTATVTVTPPASVSPVPASTTDPTGLVTLDGATGTLTADLAKLADPANPAPNTGVLTAADASKVAAGASAAAGTLVGNVGTAWDTAQSGTRISVDVSVAGLTLLGAPLLTVRQTMSGTVAELLAPSYHLPAPTVSLLGLDVGPLLAALLPALQTLLLGPLQTTVTSAVVSPVATAVSSAKASLATSLTTARAAMPADLGRLPSLVAITLNEQPDAAPFPAAAPGTGAGFRATALRVRVLGGSALDLAVATVSVGPDRTINE